MTKLWFFAGILVVAACAKSSGETGQESGMDGTSRDASGRDAAAYVQGDDGGGGACDFNVKVGDYTAAGSEFIFDIDTFAASPETTPIGGPGLISALGGDINATNYPWIVRIPTCSGLGCLDRNEYLAQIFNDSDTALTLSVGMPYSVLATGADVTVEDQKSIAAWLNGQLGSERVLVAPSVMPNDMLSMQLSRMERLAAAGNLVAWHTAPPWLSFARDEGYWLDNNDSGAGGGPEMIQKGIELGIPIFLVHKGMPRSSFFSPTYTNPKDVGPAARRFPNASFIILHSAFEHGLNNGETSRPDGTDQGWGEDKGQWPEGPYNEQDSGVQAQ